MGIEISKLLTPMLETIHDTPRERRADELIKRFENRPEVSTFLTGADTHSNPRSW